MKKLIISLLFGLALVAFTGCTGSSDGTSTKSAKCGEGKCGDAKKAESKTPAKKSQAGKCGEGKCGSK